MADRRTSPTSGLIDQAHNIPDEHFENAYFMNSYPQESTKGQSLITTIKIVSVCCLLYEIATNVGIFMAVAQYSELVAKVDSVIHTGAFGILISSAGKIISAMTARQYASVRTDRTPEKRVNTAKFFRAVSVVSFLVTVLVIHLLN